MLYEYILLLLLLFHRHLAPRKHPPDPPVKLIVLNKTDNSITLSWSRPDSERPVPINGYVVERRKMGAQTWVRVTGSELVSTSQYTISNIIEESSYQFRISAINDFGQSAYVEVPGTYYLGTWTILIIVLELYLFQDKNRSQGCTCHANNVLCLFRADCLRDIRSAKLHCRDWRGGHLKRGALRNVLRKLDAEWPTDPQWHGLPHNSLEDDPHAGDQGGDRITGRRSGQICGWRIRKRLHYQCKK